MTDKKPKPDVLKEVLDEFARKYELTPNQMYMLTTEKTKQLVTLALERGIELGEQKTPHKYKSAHKWIFEEPEVLNLTMKIPNFADRVAMRKVIVRAEQQGYEQGKLELVELLAECKRAKRCKDVPESMDEFDKGFMMCIEFARLKSQIKFKAKEVD